MTYLKFRSAFLLIVAVLWSCSARAEVNAAGRSDRQSSDGNSAAKSEARAHFERGVQLGRTGAYRQAAAEFERAYAISPHYAVLYNLAQAYVALGQPVEASDTLQRYLSEGGDNIPLARRSEVQAAIKQQQSRIAIVAVGSNVAGALILIDGVPVGRTPLDSPRRLAAGKHQVTAVLDGYQASPQTIAVAGAERARIDMVLEPLVAPPVPGIDSPTLATRRPGDTGKPPTTSTASVSLQPAVPSPDTEARHSSDPDTRRIVGFVVGAIGLIMGGATVGHYKWNESRFEDYQEKMVPDEDRRKSIVRQNTVTVTLGISSGVLLATSAILVLTARPPQPTAATTTVGMTSSGLLIAPNALGWRTTW